MISDKIGEKTVPVVDYKGLLSFDALMPIAHPPRY